jgi:hypothetical protein
MALCKMKLNFCVVNAAVDILGLSQLIKVRLERVDDELIEEFEGFFVLYAWFGVVELKFLHFFDEFWVFVVELPDELSSEEKKLVNIDVASSFEFPEFELDRNEPRSMEVEFLIELATGKNDLFF